MVTHQGFGQQDMSATIALLATAGLEFDEQRLEFDLTNASCRFIRANPFENTLALLLEVIHDLRDFNLKHVDDTGRHVAILEFF